MARPDRDVGCGGDASPPPPPPSLRPSCAATTGLDFGLAFEADFGLYLRLIWR